MSPVANTSHTAGPYEIYPFHDGIFRTSSQNLMHAGGDAPRLAAIEKWGGGELSMVVNCFALSGPDGVILVDTGSGDEEGPENGLASQALRDAGFFPESVRHVLLTHIHSDHLGGLFDGDRARYPEAIVHVPAGDLDFYVEEPGGTPSFKAKSIRNIGRLRALYGDRVSPLGAGQTLPGIESIPLPGHTPGHSGFLIGQGSDALLIWGDVIHVQDLQISDPQIGMVYDIDTAKALQTRMGIMDKAAREGWRVAGSHVNGIHRIREQGAGFAFIDP